MWSSCDWNLSGCVLCLRLQIGLITANCRAIRHMIFTRMLEAPLSVVNISDDARSIAGSQVHGDTSSTSTPRYSAVYMHKVPGRKGHV